MFHQIEELINQIHFQRAKSRDSTDVSTDGPKYTKKWLERQEQLLCELIVRFGTDFSLLQQYFPNKTRKQLKKKYKSIFQNKQWKISRIQYEFEKQRRKSFFDQEILEQNSQKKQKSSKFFDIQDQSQL